MRSKGKLAVWNDDKGFGFITPLAGGNQVFVHINAFANRERRPEVGDVISYALSKDNQGRTCAANATLAGDKLKKKTARKSRAPAILFALLFLGGVGVSVHLGALPVGILVTYAALSLMTFLVYASDKSAARSGRWRTKEGTLHLFALAGGWPGALIAQQALRHKSKKMSFRLVLWLTILMNCAALVWLHTEAGRAVLGSLFGGG
jgi:uncharacterized membrane protein YsdA (DUF1294 family)/cold shock CspA family protein